MLSAELEMCPVWRELGAATWRRRVLKDEQELAREDSLAHRALVGTGKNEGTEVRTDGWAGGGIPGAGNGGSTTGEGEKVQSSKFLDLRKLLT